MTHRFINQKPISPSILPDNKIEISQFSTIRQGRGTNTLTKITTTKNQGTKDKIADKLTIKKDGVTVSIANFSNVLGLKTTTHQLLNALMVTLTEAGVKEQGVALPLEDYMALRGLKDKKTARSQVKADLDTLYNASMSFKENIKGKDQDFYDVRIIESKGIKNGVIYASFSSQLFKVIQKYPIMSYPLALWRYNPKLNPNSYYLLKRISEHKNMNLGKKNEDIISVQTLLKATPKLPTYEEVQNSNRAFTSRIIEPFERDMDNLNDVLQWEYCKSRGEPVTDEELEKLDYDIFSKLLIKCNWHSYPDKTLYLENKEKKKKRAKKKKNN